jgi:hypothetical protein
MQIHLTSSVTITQNDKEVNVTLPEKPKRGNFLTQTEYAREWRRWMSENDPEYKTNLAKKMRQYRSNNKEKMKEINKKKYLKNCESIKQKQKEKWWSNVEESRKKLKAYSDNNIQTVMLQSIKGRCNKEKIEFNLELNYLKSIWPANNLCPVFGCEMKRNRRGQSRDFSPSVDRIVPEKGYVPGNVVIVSLKANRMKNNGTVEDLKKVLHFYESQINFL